MKKLILFTLIAFLLYACNRYTVNTDNELRSRTPFLTLEDPYYVVKIHDRSFDRGDYYYAVDPITTPDSIKLKHKDQAKQLVYELNHNFPK